jgi:hypothetical protein
VSVAAFASYCSEEQVVSAAQTRLLVAVGAFVSYFSEEQTSMGMQARSENNVGVVDSYCDRAVQMVSAWQIRPTICPVTVFGFSYWSV